MWQSVHFSFGFFFFFIFLFFFDVLNSFIHIIAQISQSFVAVSQNSTVSTRKCNFSTNYKLEPLPNGIKISLQHLQCKLHTFINQLIYSYQHSLHFCAIAKLYSQLLFGYPSQCRTVLQLCSSNQVLFDNTTTEIRKTE
jgi:hypothetical protein